MRTTLDHWTKHFTRVIPGISRELTHCSSALVSCAAAPGSTITPKGSREAVDILTIRVPAGAASDPHLRDLHDERGWWTQALEQFPCTRRGLGMRFIRDQNDEGATVGCRLHAMLAGFKIRRVRAGQYLPEASQKSVRYAHFRITRACRIRPCSPTPNPPGQVTRGSFATT